MSQRLTLTLRDWGDGTAELRAEIRAGEFSGVGAANFNRRDLRERARAFSKFPLHPQEAIEIVGGYWSKDKPARLLSEHLYIGVTQLDARGTLAMRVRLAVPDDDANRSEIRCSVSVELIVDYQQLAKFSEDLLALVGTNIEVLTLDTASQPAN